MDFDPLFEDLEARFTAEEAASTEGFSIGALLPATVVELQLQGGHKESLVAPVLGLGFVAGLHPGDHAWNVVPFSVIRSLEFHSDAPEGLPILKVQNLNLAAHLEQVPLPAKCSFRISNSDDGPTLATLVGVAQELLFVQLPGAATLRGVPVNQISSLRLWLVDNLSEEL